MNKKTYRTTKKDFLSQLREEDTQECLYSFVLDILQDTQDDDYIEVSEEENSIQIKRAD